MRTHQLLAIGCLAAVAIAILAVSHASADRAKDSKTAGPADFKLPPGWTMEDMQACMKAGTPGKVHKQLAEGVGTWHGKNTMWMSPSSEPMHSESTSKVTAIMDGRFIKVDVDGEMPGMGPYHGLGIYGFDNQSNKLVSIWIDNHGTGIMKGTGEQSDDGKTITWRYKYTCPVTKKPTTMREVETITGNDIKTLEMYGVDPKGGKEFKMMEVALTRK